MVRINEKWNKEELLKAKEVDSAIPDSRVALVICADISDSMSGEAIDELNRAINELYREVRKDSIYKNAAEVCLISFSDEINIEEPFTNVRNQREEIHLTTGGHTYLGEAVNQALDMLEERKKWYHSHEISYYQPWLIMITDGHANGDSAELERAIKRVNELKQQKKLSVLCIGTDSDANMNTLSSFSGIQKPMNLKGFSFAALFQWREPNHFSANSLPTGEEKCTIPPLDSWGEL